MTDHNDQDQKLCEGCGKRPYVTHVDDTALCQECLASIELLEDDA
jgi:hypothetical protein